jgi:hypothetical protein
MMWADTSSFSASHFRRGTEGFAVVELCLAQN